MGSKYEFQIKVRDTLTLGDLERPVMKWVSVRPKGGQPYQYDTETEAHQAAVRASMSGALGLTRVIEVQSHGK